MSNNPYEGVGSAGVQANIEYYTALVEKYERLAQEARAERKRWRGQLAPARRLEKKAVTEALPKRPRGRPFKPGALSNKERQKMYRERQLRQLLEQLSKKP